MKLLIIWSIVLMVSGCAANSNTDGEDKVLVVSELTQSCKYIRMQNCESRRENGDRRCYRRLKKMAEKAGADTVLVDEIIDHSQIIQLENNAFGDEKTIVETRFYQCNRNIKNAYSD